MLTFSIVWLVLAAAVIVSAITRRIPARVQESPDVEVPESGRAVTALAVIYGLALLAGFVWVSRFLVSTF
jgi:hypothetical protein